MQIYHVLNKIVILLILFITGVCSNHVENQNNMISFSKQTNKRLSPSVSAILLECPPKKEKCERKVLVNVRVNPTMKLDKDEQFLILDELYDTKRKTRRKILSPYVIQLSRDPPIQMFPLEFTKEVRCDKCADNNPQENNFRKLFKKKDLNEPKKINIKLNKDVEKHLKGSPPIAVDRRNFKKIQKETAQRNKYNVPSSNSNENEYLVNKDNGNQKQNHEEQLNLQLQSKLLQTQKQNLQNERAKNVRTPENPLSQQTSKHKQRRTQQLRKGSLLNLQSQNSRQIVKPLRLKQRQIQQLRLEKELEKLIHQQSEDLRPQNVHTQQKVQRESSHEQRQTEQLQEQIQKLIQRQNEDLQVDHLKAKKFNQQHDKVQFKDDGDFSNEETQNLKKAFTSKLNSNSDVMHEDFDKLNDDGSKDINEKLFEELDKLEAQPELITEDDVKFQEANSVGLDPRSCINSNCLKTKSFKKESLRKLRKIPDEKNLKPRRVHYHKRLYHKKTHLQNEKEKKDKEIEKLKSNTKENVVNIKENSNSKENSGKIVANEKSAETDNKHNVINAQNLDKVEKLEDEKNLKNEQNLLNDLNAKKNKQNLANIENTEKIKFNVINQQILPNLQNKKIETILTNKPNTENNEQKITNVENMMKIETNKNLLEEPNFNKYNQFDIPLQDITNREHSTDSDDSSQPIHRWSVKTGKSEKAMDKKFNKNNYFNAHPAKKLDKINKLTNNEHAHLDQNKVKLEKPNKDNMLQNVQLRKLTSMNSVKSSGSSNYKYVNRIPFIESIIRPARKNKFHSILKYPRNLDYVPCNKEPDSPSIEHKCNKEDMYNIKNHETMKTFYTTENGFYGSVNIDPKNIADSGLNLDNPNNNETADDITCEKCSNIRRSSIQNESDNLKKNKFTGMQDTALENLFKFKKENDKLKLQNRVKNNLNSPSRFKSSNLNAHSRIKTCLNCNNSPKKVRQKKIKQPNKNNFDNYKMDSDEEDKNYEENKNDDEKIYYDTNGYSAGINFRYPVAHRSTGTLHSQVHTPYTLGGSSRTWNVLQLKKNNQRNKLCGSSGCGAEQPVNAHSSCNECGNSDKSDCGSHSNTPQMRMGSCNSCQSSDLDDDDQSSDSDVEGGCGNCGNSINIKNQGSCGSCGSSNFNKDELIKDDRLCNSCAGKVQSFGRSCNECGNSNTEENEGEEKETTEEACGNLNMPVKAKNGTENGVFNDPNRVVGEADIDAEENLGGCDGPEGPCGNSNKKADSCGSCGSYLNGKGSYSNSYRTTNLNKHVSTDRHSLNDFTNDELNEQQNEYSQLIKRSNEEDVNPLDGNNDENLQTKNEENTINYSHNDKRNNDEEKNINSKIIDNAQIESFNDDAMQSEFYEATDVNKREALVSDKIENNNLKGNNYIVDPSLADYNYQNLNDNIMSRSIKENSDSKLTNSKETVSSQIQTEKNVVLNKNENDKFFKSTGLLNNIPPVENKLEKRAESDASVSKNTQLYSTIFGDKNLEFKDKINLLNSLQVHVSKDDLLTDTDENQGDSQKMPLIDTKKKRSFIMHNNLNKDYNDYYELDNLNAPIKLQSNIDDIDVNSNLNKKRSCTICDSKDIPMTKLPDKSYICNACVRELRSNDANLQSNNEESICEKCGGKIGDENYNEACHCSRSERDEEHLNEDELNMENLNDNLEEANLINKNNLYDSLNDDISKDFNEQKLHQVVNDRKKRSAPNIWYSVYNMSVPLQFITTRVQIYRKKQNCWWQIQPSITLTSFSAIYANDDLSIIFSSHVDIFKPDRPLKILQNHKLLVPKYNNDNETLKINNNLLAVDENKFDLNTNNLDVIRKICNIASLYQSDSNREYRDINQDIINLGDFGYFPTHMNVLEKCKNDGTHLCLNMVDEQVPAYSVKIEFPFRHNDIIPDDILQIRISDILTDATTWGILQVTVFVINEGLVAHNYIIEIKSNGIICPSIPSFVTKTLLPHISECVTFLLPLEENKPEKYNGRVIVKTLKNETVATRSMIIQPTGRCFCIWKCSCHCVSSLASSIEQNICHILPKRQVDLAGFSLNRRSITCTLWDIIIPIVIFLIILVLLLGLIKALWGCTCTKVNQFGYDYIQPMHRYEYSSVCRRFFINILFFLVIPCIYCCKCFIPNEEDELLQNNTSEWGCAVQQRTLDGYDDDSNTDYDNYRKYAGGTEDDDDDDETTILSQHIEKFSNRRSNCGITGNVFDSPYEENDTDDLNAVLQCNQTIREMNAEHSSEEINEFDSRALEAIKFVGKLIAAKIVYRTLEVAIGNVVVPDGHQYSIRGYFVPSLGTGFQFFTPVPLRQYYIICPESHTLRGIVPPNIIDSRAFTRNYSNRIAVLEAGDLSLSPSMDAPCINVLAQDRRMYNDSKCEQ